MSLKLADEKRGMKVKISNKYLDVDFGLCVTA